MKEHVVKGSEKPWIGMVKLSRPNALLMSNSDSAISSGVLVVLPKTLSLKTPSSIYVIA